MKKYSRKLPKKLPVIHEVNKGEDGAWKYDPYGHESRTAFALPYIHPDYINGADPKLLQEIWRLLSSTEHQELMIARFLSSNQIARIVPETGFTYLQCLPTVGRYSQQQNEIGYHMKLINGRDICLVFTRKMKRVNLVLDDRDYFPGPWTTSPRELYERMLSLLK